MNQTEIDTCGLVSRSSLVVVCLSVVLTIYRLAALLSSVHSSLRIIAADMPRGKTASTGSARVNPLPVLLVDLVVLLLLPRQAQLVALQRYPLLAVLNTDLGP